MMDYLLLRLPLFSLSAIAVFLEAAPFLLLGSLISGLVEVFVSTEKLERIAPRSPLKGTLFGLGLGMLIPTCECGVIPIVRRLLGKGLPPQTALAYMLAAPVLNPVVVAATYAAFRGDPWLTGGRLVIVALVAGAVGFSVSGAAPRSILREDAPEPACGCGRQHGREPSPAARTAVVLPGMAQVESVDFKAFAMQAGAASATLAALSADGAGCGAPGAMRSDPAEFAMSVPAAPALARNLRAVASHMLSDFMGAGVYLLLGCFAASAFKTFLPPETLSIVGDSPWLAVPAMMLFAVLLTICSEADAFVAASFTMMPGAAKLAFTALGPMVDLKLIAMYAAVFKPRVVALLLVVPAVLVWLLSMTFGLSLPGRGF